MKNIRTSFLQSIIKPLVHSALCLLLLLLLWSATSCSKDNTKGGTPQITGIRAITPAPADSMLTLVLPGQNVIIQGSHFNGVQAVYFDGFPASVNTALNTDHSIVLMVPTNIIFPNVAASDMNKIKVVTSAGTTEYTLFVVPPPPVISSISNEFANVGTQITIHGSYLYTVADINFPNGVDLTSGFQSSLDGSTLTVNVPAGVTGFTTTDSIQVNTAGGSIKAPFHNTFGVVANFENGDPNFGWQYWDGIWSNDATAFPGGWGYYIEIKPANTINPGDATWYGDNRGVLVTASPWQGVNMSETPDNYDIKFEMYVKGAWSNGALTMVINGDFTYIGRYAPWEATPNFTTGGWMTISIPLNIFLHVNKDNVYDPAGVPASSVGVLTGGASGATIQIMLINDGTTVLNPFDAAFDNVRVVRTK